MSSPHAQHAIYTDTQQRKEVLIHFATFNVFHQFHQKKKKNLSPFCIIIIYLSLKVWQHSTQLRLNQPTKHVFWVKWH